VSIVSNLENTVVKQDSTIRDERARADSAESSRYQALARLTEVRDTLNSVRKANDALQKLCTKKQPFIRIDGGVGLATLPFNNWETGPAITLTARVFSLRL
jgi:hypothetical protein